MFAMEQSPLHVPPPWEVPSPVQKVALSPLRSLHAFNRELSPFTEPKNDGEVSPRVDSEAVVELSNLWQQPDEEKRSIQKVNCEDSLGFVNSLGSDFEDIGGSSPRFTSVESRSVNKSKKRVQASDAARAIFNEVCRIRQVKRAKRAEQEAQEAHQNNKGYANKAVPNSQNSAISGKIEEKNEETKKKYTVTAKEKTEEIKRLEVVAGKDAYTIR